MATGAEMKRALYEGRALRRQKAEKRAKGIQAATENVLDGTCDSCEDAAEGQGVPVGPVRAAVKAARQKAVEAEMGPMCVCGHPRHNHRPDGGACRIFVVREGAACGCEAFNGR